MQIAGKMTSDHMFALGDVAETEGPKMARAALAQVHIVHGNLMAMIKGKQARATYVPDLKMEGSLHLTLGRVRTSSNPCIIQQRTDCITEGLGHMVPDLFRRRDAHPWRRREG